MVAQHGNLQDDDSKAFLASLKHTSTQKQATIEPSLNNVMLK